jgi:hypothetical protein
MLELVVFVFGVYAFVFGNVRLPWNFSLSGWRARVSGLMLMAPLPLLILLGRNVRQGVEIETAMSFFGIMELIIVIICILGAVLFAYLTRPRHSEPERYNNEPENSHDFN